MRARVMVFVGLAAAGAAAAEVRTTADDATRGAGVEPGRLALDWPAEPAVFGLVTGIEFATTELAADTPGSENGPGAGPAPTAAGRIEFVRDIAVSGGDGSARWAFGPVRVTTFDDLRGTVVSWDQAEDPHNSEAVRAPLHEAAAAMTGGVLAFRTGPHGGPDAIDGYPAFVDHAVDFLEGHGDENPFLRDRVVERLMPEPTLFAETEGFMPRLDGGAAEVGRSWSARRERRAIDLGSAMVEERYEVVAVGPADAGDAGGPAVGPMVEVAVEFVPLERVQKPEEALGTVGPEAVLVELDPEAEPGRGRLVFDAGRGAIVSWEAAIRLAHLIEAPGPSPVEPRRLRSVQTRVVSWVASGGAAAGASGASERR